ncbi:oligosaccharide flippase family protein [Paenibacillus bouchesdurhonensis]|uniref:oligosaccharide flippase family protein n=1 Tax=Paenibacillus bouchesdurhonensis TaxID=1870990 RepID=UPI000DA61AA0|nr:oligosaccharide flippase family protein [Paenibacillus bouchesdurhonensis]
MKVSRLLKQSAIRAGAMAVVKLLGLVGRVVLTRLVGAEGIGLYQIAYSLYGLLLMISGGLPTALAIITAKKPWLGWHFFKWISLFLVILGSILSMVVFWNSPVIARALGNPGLQYALRSLAPAIFAAPLLGLLRGYLQGLERFNIIALSELTEQGSRILFMLLIVGQLLSHGIHVAVGGGVLAAFIGVLVSFTLLTIYISADQRKKTTAPVPLYKLPFVWLLKTSFIISLTRLLIPASDFIDAILIPGRLMAAGYDTSRATAMYGIITGMAAIMAYTPTLVTQALSHTVTIRMASYWQRKLLPEFHKLLSVTLEAAWLWGLSAAIYLYVYAPELSLFIFNTTEAARPIQYLAILPVVVGFRELSMSILWSQDIKKATFFGLFIGIICSIVIQYVVIAIPGWGYVGAALGILVMEIISSLWNLCALKISLVRMLKRLPSLLFDAIILIASMFLVSLLSGGRSDGSMSISEFLWKTALFFSVVGVFLYTRFKGKLSTG